MTTSHRWILRLRPRCCVRTPTPRRVRQAPNYRGRHQCQTRSVRSVGSKLELGWLFNTVAHDVVRWRAVQEPQMLYTGRPTWRVEDSERWILTTMRVHVSPT